MTLSYFRRRLLLPAGLLLIAWLGAARPAGAVITFTSENNLLFSASMTVQAIVPDAAVGYRMYLTSGGAHVLSAKSSNMLSWALEAGIRLSTAATAGIDSSSITSCGIHFSTNPADPMQMYYVGISSEGRYSILLATSTDGLLWKKSSAFLFQFNNGLGFLDSPRPFLIDAATMRMFYIRDRNGANNPSDYRIASAFSSDGGLSFTDEGERLVGETAFQVSVTTLTDGRTRIYYTKPLTGETTASQVLSAISPSASGTSFTTESGVRFSTISATGLSFPVVIRSTENFRWRMFVALTTAPDTSDGRFVSSALTIDPLLLTMTPTTILNSGTAIPFTFTGELFGPSPTITFFQVGTTITATGVTVTDDLNAAGTLNPFGRGLGAYTAVYANAEGRAGYLGNAFTMDIAPGEVSISDNLFRPLKGGSAQITVQFFSAGRVTIKVYTLSGGLVAVLADQELPAGTHIFSWNGRTGLGRTVASGVYLVNIQGPKIDTVQKVVIVK